MEMLSETELLILNDFGLAPLADAERRDLLEVLEGPYDRRVTLVTNQLPFEHWHEIVGDAAFADAILDRLGPQRAPHHPERSLYAKTPRQRGVHPSQRRLVTPVSLRSDCRRLRPECVDALHQTRWTLSSGTAGTTSSEYASAL
jgi:hypothetical protein